MISTFEHGGNLYREARDNHDIEKFIDFSANINPLGLADNVQRAILANIEYLIHYPDPDGYELKQALAKFYNLPYEQIILGNGAVELLYILCHTLRPRRVLIPAPSFSEYERAARSANAAIDYYILAETDSFILDVDDFKKKLANYDMVFIGNPNNPTGTLLTKEELAIIVQTAQSTNTFVVIDESFIDFLPGAANYTAKQLLVDYDNLLVLHSLTKFYAIPGLRLGFAGTNLELSKRLHLAKDPWNVNSLAQAAGLAAIAATDYQLRSRQLLAKEQAAFELASKNFPKIKFYRPTVNFILANLASIPLTAEIMQQRCRQAGILIRNCANYPGLNDYYVRFAIKDSAANQALFVAIKNIVGDNNDKNYFDTSRPN